MLMSARFVKSWRLHKVRTASLPSLPFIRDMPRPETAVRPLCVWSHPADSQTKRATNKTESASSSQSVRVILPRNSFSNA